MSKKNTKTQPQKKHKMSSSIISYPCLSSELCSPEWCFQLLQRLADAADETHLARCRFLPCWFGEDGAFENELGALIDEIGENCETPFGIDARDFIFDSASRIMSHHFINNAFQVDFEEENITYGEVPSADGEAEVPLGQVIFRILEGVFENFKATERLRDFKISVSGGKMKPLAAKPQKYKADAWTARTGKPAKGCKEVAFDDQADIDGWIFGGTKTSTRGIAPSTPDNKRSLFNTLEEAIEAADEYGADSITQIKNGKFQLRSGKIVFPDHREAGCWVKTADSLQKGKMTKAVAENIVEEECSGGIWDM